MLLALMDGGIVNVSSDTEFSPGSCDTCDFGNMYYNHYDIELTKVIVKISASEMYEYAFSEAFMMKTLLGNIDIIKEKTELEFADWLKSKLLGEVNYVDYIIKEK